MQFAQTVFQAPQVGLVFGRFSLGPPYAKSPKMADLGGFAKFAITRLCGQFWSRRLRRNVADVCGSFGAAVCVEMLSDVCALSAY